MAFIYDLTDTWNNAGISFNGIKLNATDTASAAGSKLIDLQIGSVSKFTVGKTGTVTATGLIESTVGGFKFPDGTTQITRAVTSVTSTDGSVAITGATSVDLSAVFATSASNLLLPVRNTTGATLTKGTAVYISGATGQLSTVSKAIATGDATSAQTLGLITANIANNANGNVTLIGTITNIDTSAYTDGQQLYLSPTTAGTLTATKPYAPQHLVYMAVVEHAHPTQGKLFVKVQNGYELDELHNVSAQTPSNNHGIFYNTATSLWENKSIVTALGYTPYNSTNPAGYTTNVGTVTSVAGTGTVSGLSLTGSVTTSGSLTLGGTLILTSGQVTDGLGYTPYNATNPAGYTTNVGTVTSVSGTGTVNGLTLTGSVTTSGSLTLGGTLGNIANSQLTNSAITINGTSTALGGSISVGTVTSVAALTLGTSGTDLASSVANGTTTPVITLNVPTASATNRGALSSSDWSTFNAKQAALVSGTNIKTVGGASLLGSGDVGTIGLAYGGTGATTASGARTALGLGTAAVLNAGVSGGVATLDGSGTVPTSQLPGAVLGGLNYQGTWNASTNTPTLASSTGSKGYYYVVSVAGSTNLNGITDWKIGDWAVYDGTTWQKVDNTDAVSSVNGYTGAVVLTTSDVAQGTNLYFTQAAARGSVSAGTGISYDSGTGVITNSAPDQTVALTGAGTTVVTGTYPNFTITSNDSTVGTVTSVNLTAGTGVSVSGGPITSSGAITVTNTAPDQVVSLTGAGTTTVTGTYPNFTVTSNDSTVGTVTSVSGTGTVSGLTLTGTVTTSGNLTLGGTLAVTASDFASQTAKTFLAAPNASAGVPSFRAIIPADVPTLNQNTTGTASNVTGTVAVTNGGTGATSLSSGYLLKGNGTSAVSASVVYDDGTNVGIGTTSTLAKLHVAANATYQQYLTGTDINQQLRLGYDTTNNVGKIQSVQVGVGFKDLALQPEGGNVGIGTTSPASKLNVSGGNVTISAGYGIAWSGDQTRIMTPEDNVIGALINWGAGGGCRFISGTSERMRIDGSGNVGIGTSAPGAKLDVAGAGVFKLDGSGSTTPLILRNNNTASVQAVKLGFDSNGAVKASINAAVYGNDYMTFNVGSDTERMRIDASGNVGIGTSSPGGTYGKLTVAGGIRTTDDANSKLEIGRYSAGAPNSYIKLGPNSASLRFTNAADDTDLMVLTNSGSLLVGTGVNNFGSKMEITTSGSSNLLSLYNTTANGGAKIRFLDGTNNAGVGNVGGNLLFYANSADTERMRVDSSGNVGIGTSSPAYRADILGVGVGNSAVQPLLQLRSASDALSNSVEMLLTPIISGQTRTAIGGVREGATANAAIYMATNNAERMRIASDGNVSIGNAAIPYAATGRTVFNVNGTSSTIMSLQTAGSNRGYLYADGSLLSLETETGVTLRLTTNAAQPITFVTNGSERARIDSSGNLLVGTTSSSSSSTDNGLIIRGDFPGFIVSRRSSGGGQGHMVFVNGGAEVGSITSSTTTTTYATSSDVRLKHDIIDAPDASSLIDAMQVRSFKWNADNSEQRYGFVAQELVTVAPEAVSQPEDSDDMMGVDYSKLVPMLVKELQSVRARLAQLEGN